MFQYHGVLTARELSLAMAHNKAVFDTEEYEIGGWEWDSEDGYQPTVEGYDMLLVDGNMEWSVCKEVLLPTCVV